MQEVLYIFILITLVLFFLLVLYTASKINSLTGKIGKIQDLLEKFKNLSMEPETNSDTHGPNKTL
jgi:predicted PurR-regulated permease PerM